MRMGFVTREFVTEDKYWGGMGNYLYRIARALVEAGHEIHIITHSKHPAGDLMHDGMYVHRLNSGRVRRWVRRLTRGRFPDCGHSLDFALQACRLLRNLHRDRPFDFVQYSNLCITALLVKYFVNIPGAMRLSSLMDLRKNPPEFQSWDMQLRQKLERLQVRTTPFVYAPSYFTKRSVERLFNVPVRVVRPPFYLECAHPDPRVYECRLKGKAYLLYFGRLVAHKGFLVLAEALPKILEAHPDLYAVCIGSDQPTRVSPSIRDETLLLCRKNRDRLIFFDELPHAQLYPILEHARLVIQPSLVENFSNACLEAMAMGRPVIAASGSSFEELIQHRVSGFLVPAGDPEALANQISKVWNSGELAQIGACAKKKIEEFSPDRTLKDFLDFVAHVRAEWGK